MSTPQRYDTGSPIQARRGDSLADILERVLDKGIVIAGDITINLLEIELLTIKVRLLIASVDKAREMGINWWESDNALSNGGAKKGGGQGAGGRGGAGGGGTAARKKGGGGGKGGPRPSP